MQFRLLYHNDGREFPPELEGEPTSEIEAAGVHMYGIAEVSAPPLEVDSAQIQFHADEYHNYVAEKPFLVVNDLGERPWVKPVGVSPHNTALRAASPGLLRPVYHVDVRGRALDSFASNNGRMMAIQLDRQGRSLVLNCVR